MHVHHLVSNIFGIFLGHPSKLSLDLSTKWSQGIDLTVCIGHILHLYIEKETKITKVHKVRK